MRQGNFRQIEPNKIAVNEKKYSFPQYGISLLVFICFPFFIAAQNQKSIPYQQLRVTVVDQFLQTTIEGATVSISASNRTVITDAKGNFRFDSVTIGIHQLVISSIA